MARRIWEVAVAGLQVTSRRRGGRSQHYCGSLDCGLPLGAFWQHKANAKCTRSMPDCVAMIIIVRRLRCKRYDIDSKYVFNVKASE